MIYVGTAGVPLSAPDRGTAEGIRFVRKLGLDAMEVEFVHNIYLTLEEARKVAEAGREADVRLSVHAPYYINLASDDPAKIEASKKRILDSARVGGLLNAKIVVFHPAYYLKKTPDEAYGMVRDAVLEVREKLDQEGNKILLGPETTGKLSQFGTLDELIRLSQEVGGVLPTVDFGHLHARSNGGLKSRDDFMNVFGVMEGGLGKVGYHIHVAGVEYTERGERRHSTIDSLEPDYRLLAEVLRENEYDATIISESPNIEVDALKMKKMLS